MHNKAEVNYTFDPPCTFIISKIVPGSILYVKYISTLLILNTFILKGRYYAQVSLSSENHSRCQRALHEEITHTTETDTNRATEHFTGPVKKGDIPSYQASGKNCYKT